MMAPLSGDWGGVPAPATTSSMGGKTNVVMFDTTKNPVYKLGEGYRLEITTFYVYWLSFWEKEEAIS